MGSVSLQDGAMLFMLYPLFHPYTRSLAHRRMFTLEYSRLFVVLLAVTASLIFLTTFFSEAKTPPVTFYVLHFLWVAVPEEYCFRVVFFHLWDSRLNRGSIWGAVILNAVIFTAFHWIKGITFVNGIIFFPAVFLAWVYRKTGDFLLVAVLHLAFNLIYFEFLSKIPLNF